MKTALRLVTICLGLGLCSTHADTIPGASPHDDRIGYADYKPDEVYSIIVAKGVVTRLILGAGETVVKSGTGFPAACLSGQEWCIEAEKGADQIWVKPLTGATSNNLEMQTTRGDYSIRFVVASGAEKAKGVFYRVIFRHPVALPPVRLAMPTPSDSEDSNPITSQRQQAQRSAKSETSASDIVLTPQVRNYDFSKKHTPDAGDLAPSVVFDDGRFTYLRFERSQEVPAVFAVAPDGSEVRVATHSERLAGDPEHPDSKVERDYLVIQRVARKFILRLGAAVIEIINNKFDAKGVETLDGTSTDKLVRDDKKDEQRDDNP